MKQRRKESGFALLLVFLLAACVAITLYTEVPRVAFEAERQRELLLIDRGNQFKRAIQVFCTDKTNNPTARYPASVDELENFNNHRYLRHRYRDPMTGKDEWRLIHINGNVLTDSVTMQANPTTGQQAGSGPPAPAYITSTSYTDSSDPTGAKGGGAARAMIRRPSDSLTPGGPNGSGGDAGVNPGGSTGMQGNAGGVYPGAPTSTLPPGVPGQGGTGQPGIAGVPGQNGLPNLPRPGLPGSVPGLNGQPSGAQSPQPCNAYIGTCASTSSTPVAGVPPQPGQGIVPQTPGMGSSIGAGSPSGPGQSGSPVPQAGGVAANMINNLLTSPRPGGMPTGMPGSTTVGGGIAGVASKFEAEGIMVINDRTAINEWEYIFDKSKYRAPPNPVAGAVGTPMQPMQGGGTGTPIGGGGGPQQPGMGTPNPNSAGGGH